MLLKKVDSVAMQLMNQRETGLISLTLLAQISNQMVFEIMTAVAFFLQEWAVEFGIEICK